MREGHISELGTPESYVEATPVFIRPTLAYVINFLKQHNHMT